MDETTWNQLSEDERQAALTELGAGYSGEEIEAWKARGFDGLPSGVRIALEDHGKSDEEIEASDDEMDDEDDEEKEEA